MNINTFQFDQLLTGLILEFKRKKSASNFDELLSHYESKTLKLFCMGMIYNLKEETLVTNF